MIGFLEVVKELDADAQCWYKWEWSLNVGKMNGEKVGQCYQEKRFA